MKRPADMDFAIPSPPPTDPQSPDSHTDDNEAGPSRKRARSEVTSEERREARAHRNRIAAQNSRDRRKAQFSYLERRVQELEDENRQLRTGMGLTELSRPTEQKDEEREKDKARERENEELRQRVKTLETGWEAVMKALAASGLPLSIPSAPTSTTPSSSASSSNASASATSGQLSPTTTFPVFVPHSPIFPISPAPSYTSSGSSTLYDSDDFDSTRHLARVATTDAPPGGSECSPNRLQLELNIPPPSYPPTIHIGDSAQSTVDEVIMDDLFREILAPSPVSPQAPLPAGPTPSRSRSQSISEIKLAPAPTASVTPTPVLPEIDWESEVEMQRLLAMLPVVQSDATPLDTSVGMSPDDFPSALDLELSGWDLASTAPFGSMSSVSVF
ncbi:hypothetical protein C8Q80DRAFT_1106541 [Daedaleopsis nitida]|nr:hypothetical protein C8Q80DRAFT_1106541 [Daedaleopsis nitida]